MGGAVINKARDGRGRSHRGFRQAVHRDRGGARAARRVPVRTGRLDLVRAWLDELEDFADGTGVRSAIAAAEHGRALVADGAAAEDPFAVPWPRTPPRRGDRTGPAPSWRTGVPAPHPPPSCAPPARPPA